MLLKHIFSIFFLFINYSVFSQFELFIEYSRNVKPTGYTMKLDSILHKYQDNFMNFKYLRKFYEKVQFEYSDNNQIKKVTFYYLDTSSNTYKLDYSYVFNHLNNNVTEFNYNIYPKDSIYPIGSKLKFSTTNFTNHKIDSIFEFKNFNWEYFRRDITYFNQNKSIDSIHKHALNSKGQDTIIFSKYYEINPFSNLVIKDYSIPDIDDKHVNFYFYNSNNRLDSLYNTLDTIGKSFLYREIMLYDQFGNLDSVPIHYYAYRNGKNLFLDDSSYSVFIHDYNYKMSEALFPYVNEYYGNPHTNLLMKELEAANKGSYYYYGHIRNFYYSKLSLSSISNSKFKNSIYPNPSQGIVKIEIEKPSRLSIRNQLGQTVFDQNIEHNTDINLSHFCSGTYFYQLIRNETPI